MSYLGFGKIRLMSLLEQFGPSRRELQVMSHGWTPTTHKRELLWHQDSQSAPIAWCYNFSLCQVLESRHVSAPCCAEGTKLLKTHCSMPASWWHRTSAFKKATVLKKARLIPSKKKGFAQQGIAQVRLYLFIFLIGDLKNAETMIHIEAARPSKEERGWFGVQKPKTSVEHQDQPLSNSCFLNYKLKMMVPTYRVESIKGDETS